MKNIEINNVNYEVVTDYNDAIDEEEIKEKLTDYFDDFDYIVGDWAYSKLRLKGFYKEDNKKVSKINNIKDLDNYLKNNCAYGCRYFVLLKK
ncbi:MAG: DUF1027 domain-containing protein [Firmicutes bacterium]|nr:DUF1027 domain-containing protein [Bacillota bacterium]